MSDLERARSLSADQMWAAAVRETGIWLTPYSDAVAEFGRLLIPQIRESLAAARLEGAEEMRERAAQEAENLWFDARDTEWDEGVNCAKRRVAHAIRVLSLTPGEPT